MSGNNASNERTLTQKNVGQILQLLQQIKLGQQTANNSENNANVNPGGMDGIDNFFNSYAYFLQINSDSWIMDSSASEHMTFNK